MARELFKRFPDLKKQFWDGEFWKNGDKVAMAPRRGDWNTLLQYVRNQEQAPEEAGLQMLLPESKHEMDAILDDGKTGYT